MFDYKGCKEKIEKEINSLNFTIPPVELYKPIDYVLSIGGKRIRPCLLMMACNIFKDNIDDSIHPALAIEVFHNFTLLHDDIMDHAVLRRNHPTVHMKWDTNVAILSGDAMITKSYQILSNSKADKLSDLLHEFNKASLEVCEGQMYDMNFEKNIDVSVDDYINMIRLKTSVLIACALKMGAIMGDASKEDQQLIYDFGLNLGIGFQLQDDMLDTYGDSATFGKKIGGDIVANKKTYLLTTALTKAKGKTYDDLIRLVTTYEVSREEKLEQAMKIYAELDIKQLTQQKIDEYFEKASDCLAKISVGEERKVEMKKVVEMLINRFI